MSTLIRPSMWTPDKGIDTVFPGRFSTTTPKNGMELVNLRALGIMPSAVGGAEGFHVAADVVTQTADGRPLNDIWTEFMALLSAVNTDRQGLISFLTYGVTNPIETVAQPGQGVDFEDASEFGEPVGQRISPAYFNMGYSFKWYDLAARYTWQYLADATSQMVEAVANAAVEAYYRKLLFEVLKRIFTPTTGMATINGNAYNVYGFYNGSQGADVTTPPAYKNNTFASTHTHYRTTGEADNVAPISAPDIDTLIIDDFASHGYSFETGYRQVLMAHSTVAETIRGFRSVANGGAGRYDFIPAVNQPGQVMPLNEQYVGATRVPGTHNGLRVIGTYGPVTIVSEDWMPTTHVFAFVTGGTNSLSNPVGLRQHAQAGLRGLRLVKGRQPNYPLIDSFWATGFGTGIRHRGGGIVIELTANDTYTVPTDYA